MLHLLYHCRSCTFDACIPLSGASLYATVCLPTVSRFVASPRPEDIQASPDVVEPGGTNAIAECMSLSRPAISKRVNGLECHLGVRLLHRSTCDVEPTKASGFFYRPAKVSLQDLSNAVESVALRENDLYGELWAMVPTSPGTFWLGSPVTEFMARNLRLEVVL